MKTRLGFVSNSSSTGFMVDLKSFEDEEFYGRFMSIIQDYYYEPQFENYSQLYVSTGMSYGNECVRNWYKLRSLLRENNIRFDEQGSGCPVDDEQKELDFIYDAVSEDALDQVLTIPQTRKWLNGESDVRLDELAKIYNVTRDSVKLNVKYKDAINDTLN